MPYDVAIAGGGLVGLAVRAALARQYPELSSIVFEPTAKPNPTKVTRNIFLNHTSLRLLKSWGVVFAKGKFAPINKVNWQAPPALQLDAQTAGLANVGVAVSQEFLLHQLWPPDDCIVGQSLTEARVQPDGNWLLASNKDKYQARLLILADGAPSKLAQALGVQYDQRDYRQSASVALVGTQQQQPDDQAWQFWLAQGVLTLVPRPAPRRSYALIMTGEQTYSAAGMLELLDNLATSGLEQLSIEREAINFPLHYYRARERARRGLLLMGNAALNLHPLGAQSLNLHLRSVDAAMNSLRSLQPDAATLAQRYLQATDKDFARTETLVNTTVRLEHKVSQQPALLKTIGQIINSSTHTRNTILRTVSRHYA